MSENVRKNRKFKYNRQVVLKRQEKVAELYYIRCYPLWKIAELLDWDEKTIYRDINKIRKNFQDTIPLVTTEDIWNKIWASRTEVLQRLWIVADKARKKAEDFDAERRALIAIDKIRDKDVHTLQELGFIPRPEDRVSVTTTEKDMLEKFDIIFGRKKKDEK